jgi:hypothetical protein
MPKIVKTALGNTVDWDLMRIQAQQQNNVAEPVELAQKTTTQADRRAQRAKMEAARKLLADAKQQEARLQQISTLPPLDESEGAEWEEQEQPTTKSSTKQKTKHA